MRSLGNYAISVNALRLTEVTHDATAIEFELGS